MNEYQKRVLEARKGIIKLTLEQQKEIQKIYDDLGKNMIPKILNMKDCRTKIHQIEIYKIINQYQTELYNKLNESITDAINKAASIEMGVQLSFVDMIAPNIGIKEALNKTITNISSQAVEQLVKGNYYKDGKTLSKRIWGYTERNYSQIDKIIKSNIAKGANVKELAKSLNGFVRPGARTEANVNRLGLDKSICYQAQRLARTSITHAQTEVKIQNAKKNPFCKGLRWCLSSSHERDDICDNYEGRVFEPDDVPLQHPNCMCYFEDVLDDMDDVINRINKWAEGAEDKELDKWSTEFNTNEDNSKNSINDSVKVNGKGGTINIKVPKTNNKKTDTNVGKNDIIKSNRLIEIENRLKNLDVTKYTSRRKLGKDILDSLDLNNIPVSVRKIDAHGFCSFSNSDTMNITEYVLNSNDYRNNNYKIKTALHEAFHAKAHGMKIDYFNIKKEWVHVEETLTESAAHYMAKQLGIKQEIAPAYSDKLVDMLPRLKQLDKFKECIKISDFGRIAWEDRLNGVEPIWAELYDECMKIKHDWKEYSKQYFEYISKNSEELINKMLENMPKFVDYKEQMIDECNSAMEAVNLGEKLTGNEPMILRNVLIIAMNRVGVK